MVKDAVFRRLIHNGFCRNVAQPEGGGSEGCLRLFNQPDCKSQAAFSVTNLDVGTMRQPRIKGGARPSFRLTFEALALNPPDLHLTQPSAGD